MTDEEHEDASSDAIVAKGGMNTNSMTTLLLTFIGKRIEEKWRDEELKWEEHKRKMLGNLDGKSDK